MSHRLVSLPARALALLALLLSSLVAVSDAGAVGAPTPQWATFFQQALAGEQGYAYIVAQNGQVVASGVSGLARSTHEGQNPSVPWTVDTRMNLASVSKTVTAVAVMSLVQQGKISLTAPFLPYIQSRITSPVAAGISTVTITNLLQMKSGMVPDNPRNYAGTLTQYLNTYLQKPLIGTPGVTYAYSDTNFDILQTVIDQVAPTLTPAYTDYTDYVTRAILTPMGVNTTLFSTTPDPQGAATLSYSAAGDTRMGQYWAYTANVLGSGGWVAPVSEAIKFAIGVRNNVVLSAAMTDTMFTQLLGWYANNGLYGTYYQHNGGLSNAATPSQGLNTGLIHFSNGYDAVLLVNSPSPNIIAEMIGAFEAAAPTLTASPMQVPFGQSSTTLAFNTNDGGVATLCVAGNGGAEAPFAGGPSGTAMATFINSGAYVFTLHAGASCAGAALASVTVTKLNPKGTTGPAILAAPATLSFATATTNLVRSSTINFDTGDSSVGQVMLSVNGSTPQLFSASQFGSVTAPWIFSGTYTFTLLKGGIIVDTATVATTAQISSPKGTTSGGPNPNVTTTVGKPVPLTFDTGTGQAAALCTQFGGLVSFSQNGAGNATSVDTAGAITYSLHVGSCAGALATPGTVTVTAS